MRLNFSTRDWLWFCVVLALAIGWGTHVRYSSYIEATPIPPPISNQELLESLRTATDDNERYRIEVQALRYGIQAAKLTDDQKEALEKTAQEARTDPYWPN